MPIPDLDPHAARLARLRHAAARSETVEAEVAREVLAGDQPLWLGEPEFLLALATAARPLSRQQRARLMRLALRTGRGDLPRRLLQAALQAARTTTA